MPKPAPGEKTSAPSPGAELELSDAVRGQLLDPSFWREGLEPYARATNLAVVLTDAHGRPLAPCLNPRPTWRRLRAAQPAQVRSCPFALTPAPGPACTCVADALARGKAALARDRCGLVHFAVPLLLGAQPLGALLGGQVFDRYPEQHLLEQMATRLGAPVHEVWQLARLESPVKEATLRVYADLLATLASDRLRNGYHTIREAQRLAELGRLSDQLIEADQRKDRFLAMLAHELRNPLAPICNAIAVMQSTHRTDADLHWARDVVARQVRHLVRLVDDLLDVSRFTSGKITLRKERTSLAAVAMQAIEAARPAIEGRRQALVVDISGEALPVEGDPVRLVQVLSNLLNNAGKFTPEGGRIALTAGCEDGEAVVRVRDTGIGIRAAMIPQIFDLFAQDARTLDRSEGGLGIGLTLVRDLVELHGGRVQALSEGPHQGSEFVVRLPLVTEEQPQQAGAAGPAGECAPESGRRLLVVDDNRDAADSLARLLRREGHEVHVAYDGATALAAAQDVLPEAILLDIGLPGMDGFEVARRLRQQPALGDALMIALSGYGQDEDRRHSREAGFDQHLVKPFDLGVLRDLMARHGRAPVEEDPRRVRTCPGR